MRRHWLFAVLITGCLAVALPLSFNTTSARALGAPGLMALDSSAQNGFKKGVEGSGGSDASNVQDLLKSSINLLLYIAGVVAVIIIIISSIRFVTSEGDSAAATKARNGVVYALVGLVLAVLAYVLVNFVLQALK